MSYKLGERLGSYQVNSKFFKVYDGGKEQKDLDKPIWYIFGGNGTNGPKILNGYCKDLENFIAYRLKRDYRYEDIYDQVRIMGVIYETSEEDDVFRFSKDDCVSFAKTRLMPLFLDNKGRLLSKEECKKNLSNINFFSHSYGAEVVDNVFFELKVMLVECIVKECRGKTKRISDISSMTDIQEIFDSCFHVAYAPVVDSTHIPTVRIKSLKDEFYSKRYMRHAKQCLGGDEFNGVSIAYFNPHDNICDYFKSDCHSPCVEIWSSCLLNNGYPRFKMDEHQFCITRNKDDELCDVGENNNYSETNMNADCVSNIVASILTMATDRSIKNNKTPNSPVIQCNMQKYLLKAREIHNCYHLDELAFSEMSKKEKLRYFFSKLLSGGMGR